MTNITESSREPVPKRQLHLESILYYKISIWLWLYFAPVLIFGGGISNILAIIVLRNRRFKGTGTTFLLTALAVADFTVLMNNVLSAWILYLTDYKIDLKSLTDAGCKLYTFISYFGPQWSAWTLVLVTAERAVSVWMPFKVKVLCRRKRIVIAWILFTLVVAAVNSPIVTNTKLFVRLYLHPENTTRIIKCCQFTAGTYRDTVLTDFVMFNAGPSFLIVFFNILIVVKLLRPQIDRHNDKKAKKAISSVTIMLFVVSVIFLVTTTPVAVYFLGQGTFIEDSPRDLYSSRIPPEFADHRLAQVVCILVSHINNSINFLLYSLSGERFRKAITDMLCGPCINKSHSVESTKL